MQPESCRVCDAHPGRERPQEYLYWNDRIIRWQPPIIVSYCSVPRSHRSDWPCGYKAQTCRGEPTTCPRCRFSFCERHFAGHIVNFEAPPDVWLTFRKRLAAALTEVGERRRKRIRVPHPTPDGMEREEE